MAQVSKQRERLTLPGFGLPIDTMPGPNDRFPHAIADRFFVSGKGVMSREIRMLEFVNKISDKPEWDRKVFDEVIVAKWEKEACRYVDGLRDEYLSTQMFQFCIKELREKAEIYQKEGYVAVIDANATVVKSDITIPETLRRDLIQEAGLLEQVPDNLKDWHPGSNKMVLDLLHPSLFPLVYGRSRVLPFGNVPLKECAKFTGLGEVLTGWGRGNLEKRTWDTITQGLLEPWGNYQWLPVQVELATEGRPHITSYINNLHPEKHEALYSLLEQFVDRTIPLWNECLSWSWFSDRVRIPTTDVVFYSDEDWIVPSWPLRAKHPDNQLEGDEELDRSAKINECWADEHDLLGEWEDWKSANLRLKPIEPRTYQSFYQMLQKSNAPARHINLKADFNSTGLQIIFKLASIHLTPDKPKYDGGRWHVEGALNEHICATALYYYDSDNISPSSLAFRQSMHTEDIDGLTGEQDQYDSFCAYYGVQNMGSGIQELGRVLTPQGRLLVFPNVLQHYVEPFHLADPTRPGHRKILAMFLVDPHITVLSTANVPPQRRDWWADEVRKISPFDGLPYELFLRIVEFVDGFPMSWQDACEVREGLMEERGRIADRIDEIMDENQFSFCEH